jgi:hypothetical protein
MYTRNVSRLILATLLIACFKPLAFADAWRATDSAAAWGRSPSVLTGTDTPPAGTFTWFSADAGQHDMWLFDYTSNDANGSTPADIVWDSNMKWLNTAIQAFRDDPTLNIVHEIRVERNLYEADSYASSNFAYWVHNEDDTEAEEIAQGYEEKELGTLLPERFAEYASIEVRTHWLSIGNGSGRFVSESELTKEGVCDPFCHDAWYPRGFRELGYMNFTIPAPPPDLTVTALNGPSSASTGGSISVSASLLNQRANDSGAFRLGFYLSTDSTITTGDRLIASCSYSSLVAGGSSTCGGSASIPSNVAPGSYYLGAIADYQNAVIEASDNNNTRAVGPITITGPQPIMWGFNTNGNIQGWATFNLAAWLVNNGVLFLDPNGGDFYISSPAISADASTYRYIRMNMASNATDGNLQIYFKTDLENFYSQDKLLQFTVSNCSLCGNAAFNTRSYYMGGHAKWRGRITGIRIDPSLSGTAGTNRDSIGIDFISLQPTP